MSNAAQPRSRSPQGTIRYINGFPIFIEDPDPEPSHVPTDPITSAPPAVAENPGVFTENSGNKLLAPPAPNPNSTIRNVNPVVPVATMSDTSYIQSISDYEDGNDINRAFMQTSGPAMPQPGPNGRLLAVGNSTHPGSYNSYTTLEQPDHEGASSPIHGLDLNAPMDSAFLPYHNNIELPIRHSSPAAQFRVPPGMPGGLPYEMMPIYQRPGPNGLGHRIHPSNSTGQLFAPRAIPQSNSFPSLNEAGAVAARNLIASNGSVHSLDSQVIWSPWEDSNSTTLVNSSGAGSGTSGSSVQELQGARLAALARNLPGAWVYTPGGPGPSTTSYMPSHFSSSSSSVPSSRVATEGMNDSSGAMNAVFEPSSSNQAATFATAFHDASTIQAPPAMGRQFGNEMFNFNTEVPGSNSNSFFGGEFAGQDLDNHAPPGTAPPRRRRGLLGNLPRTDHITVQDALRMTGARPSLPNLRGDSPTRGFYDEHGVRWVPEYTLATNVPNGSSSSTRISTARAPQEASHGEENGTSCDASEADDPNNMAQDGSSQYSRQGSHTTTLSGGGGGGGDGDGGSGGAGPSDSAGGQFRGGRHVNSVPPGTLILPNPSRRSRANIIRDQSRQPSGKRTPLPTSAGVNRIIKPGRLTGYHILSGPPCRDLARTRKSSVSSVIPRSRGCAADDQILLAGRLAGLTYKQIRETELPDWPESSLRGRHRTLTKPASARVRKPFWTEVDIHLLDQAVKQQTREAGRNEVSATKISWKLVALHILQHGGSYQFGNSTCRKKWEELVHNGVFSLLA